MQFLWWRIPAKHLPKSEAWGCRVLLDCGVAVAVLLGRLWFFSTPFGQTKTVCFGRRQLQTASNSTSNKQLDQTRYIVDVVDVRPEDRRYPELGKLETWWTWLTCLFLTSFCSLKTNHVSLWFCDLSISFILNSESNSYFGLASPMSWLCHDLIICRRWFAKDVGKLDLVLLSHFHLVGGTKPTQTILNTTVIICNHFPSGPSSFRGYVVLMLRYVVIIRIVGVKACLARTMPVPCWALGAECRMVYCALQPWTEIIWAVHFWFIVALFKRTSASTTKRNT